MSASFAAWTPAHIAKGALAGALSLSLGAFVLSAQVPGAGALEAAGGPHAVQTAAAARSEAVVVAVRAVDEAFQARTVANATEVAADKVVELEAATQDLNRLIDAARRAGDQVQLVAPEPVRDDANGADARDDGAAPTPPAPTPPAPTSPVPPTPQPSGTGQGQPAADDAASGTADTADGADTTGETQAPPSATSESDQPARAVAPAPEVGTDTSEPLDEGSLAEYLVARAEPVVATSGVPEDVTTVELRAAVQEVARLSGEIALAAKTSIDEAAAAEALAEAVAEKTGVELAIEQTEAEEKAAAELRRAAEEAARRAEWKVSLERYANGQIPNSALCELDFDASQQLRCDAAEAMEELDDAFAQTFGRHVTISDSYRSYAGQVACSATKGNLCAAPGTSNHGTGIALDFGGGVQAFGSAEHRWMQANAAEFGWEHPSWAQLNGNKPEAWHWEYIG